MYFNIKFNLDDLLSFPSAQEVSGEAAPGILCGVLRPSVQERPGHAGESQPEGHKDDEGMEAPLL